MAGGSAWTRRVSARTRTLRGLVLDTQRAMHDVCDILQFDPEVLATVQEIGKLSLRTTALVILGTTPSAKARLLHCLLGRQLLPDPPPRGCRWIRISYGSTTQVHLTLGNSEFELVEELECNKRSWDTLPVEDLSRQDNADLSKILEVEINNQFLKDGIRIIIPPDIESEPGDTDLMTLKKMYNELYCKRDSILKTVHPVYLYGVDRTGKNIFNDDIVNLFEEKGRGSREPAVFTGENCLDLHQTKDMNTKAQVLFVLFSDSMEMATADECSRSGDRVRLSTEATESTEGNVCCDELPESDQGLIQDGILRNGLESPEATKRDSRRLYEEQIGFMNELLDQWELMSTPPQKHQVKSQWMILNDSEVMRTAGMKLISCEGREKDGEKTVRSKTVLFNTMVKFAYDCLQGYLLEYCTMLSEVHVKLLQQFILASFDMARELQVVPKKIQYVARQEQHLYETINDKFTEGDKKQELLKIMQDVLQEMRAEVNNMDWSVDDFPWHQDRRFVTSNSVFYSSLRCSPAVGLQDFPEGPRDASEGEEALNIDCNIDEYEIIHDNDERLSCASYPTSQADIPSCQYNEIHVENESGSLSVSSASVGASTLWASGLTGASDVTRASGMTSCTNAANISVKQASLDVQQTVLSKLSRKISLRLVKFVDCLKDTYFGTLQRCLQSLETSCRCELGDRPASEAMRQLVCVARAVDLAPIASFSLLRTLLDSLRRLLHRLRIVGGEAEEACCVLSPVWRRQVALNSIQSLSPQRLARVISAQILERLSEAHARYQAALWRLQAAVGARLLHTEDNKLALRKIHAPLVARLCLESTSLCDLLLHGVPELGREIGRGQYGVVYSVRGSWAGMSPAAVKSVLPADERHYHELAMEFFYTRSIPAHPRIVRLYGSIVQRHSGSGPNVLLVSERKCRDLHAAVRAGLSFATRIRISCDIVEGIRYLHSLGLVHRDIKMKNVLLDSACRAALSDLGFCAAEALMSGSVVGTPVHMAPELLAGDYDAAVDVYAFGILFWYVCAGNIKLPSAFEMFQNKEQLWSKVKRGLRPERLPHFSDECWEIMESCWASEPSQRALLGEVQPKLERILETALVEEQEKTQTDESRGYDYSDDDSLYMTGIHKNCL